MGSACSSDAPNNGGSAQKYDTKATHGDGPALTTKTGTTPSQSPTNKNHTTGTGAAPMKPHQRGHTRGQSIDVLSTTSAAGFGAGTAGADGESQSGVMRDTNTPEPTSRLEVPGTIASPTDRNKARKLTDAQIDKLKANSLKASIFGECLTQEQLLFLATQCEIKKWSKIGDRICEQGAKAECMYIVHKGEVLLEVQDHNLDNRVNQLQVAKVLQEQDLVPLTDANGAPIPKDNQPKTPTRSGARTLNPSTLHPSSLAHPNNAGRGGGSVAPGQTRNSHAAPLTKAELIALEAATRIEQETLGVNGLAGGADTDGETTGVAGGLNTKNKSTRNSMSVPSPLLAPHSPSTSAVNQVNDPEFAALVSTLPATYTAENTMYMCVKSPTQTFGVGMFFAHGRYMYSAINNALSTHLIILPRKGFDTLWKKYPDTREGLMKHLGENLENSLMQTKWLSNPTIVPPQKLTLLTSLFHHASVPSGTMLFEEGDICSDDSPLYFILEGQVELTFTNEKGHKLSKILSKGSIFGELGVLLGFSITASAMTIENCIFRLCKRRWLNLFCMMCPQLVPTLRSTVTKNYHVRDEQLLENIHIQSAFTEFCLKEFNAENVEFWTVAIRFRKTIFPSVCHLMDEVLSEAARIYNRYISETAVLQINIKQAVRSNIKETLQSGEVTKDLFVHAEREICQLMLQDTFTRFKSTPLYAQSLNMLHSPPPCPILLNHTNISQHHSGLSAQIRAKEYSRTDDGQAQAQPSPAGQARRQLSLDVDTREGAVAVPLMFGGGKRALAVHTGNGPIGSVHNNSSSRATGAGASQARGTGASTGGGGVATSPNDTGRSSSDDGDLNPLNTPVYGPQTTGGANYLATPQNPTAHLQLSPSTGMFRLAKNNEPISPTNSDQPRKRSFALDAEPVTESSSDISSSPPAASQATTDQDAAAAAAAALVTAELAKSDLTQPQQQKAKDPAEEKTDVTQTQTPPVAAATTSTKAKPKPKISNVQPDTSKGTPPSIPKQKLQPREKRQPSGSPPTSQTG